MNLLLQPRGGGGGGGHGRGGSIFGSGTGGIGGGGGGGGAGGCRTGISKASSFLNVSLGAISNLGERGQLRFERVLPDDPGRAE